MSLKTSVHEVYVASITTFIFGCYNSLEETLTHMKSLKLKSYTVDNVTYFCAAILVDAERLDNAGELQCKHIGHITHIFEDSSHSIFHL